ncbi:hypothetical protein JQX08_14460 [Pseudomonas sp. UL073]|uniref:Uncharacterized protein n=1 Tax=Zestomonas insulae TaxID=2809017 RepID=A0ABS2IIY9_9GAMM|nr:hypothetical protein [Pseudomonas insulae]MBM7061910.1 hypothetical protein [Pseudomonas insulae]
MFKDFPHHVAWTDAMRDGPRYIGLIEYQPKRPGSRVNVLWVVLPDCACEAEAETAADDMLREIRDITRDGQVIYSDGVALDS